MESGEKRLKYISADGPQGLAKVLDDLLEQCHKDPSACANQYILYQVGSQRSLIKVDLTQQPFQFWYNDLLGRPATRGVKETIARFVWEKGGERERFLREFAGEKHG